MKQMNRLAQSGYPTAMASIRNKCLDCCCWQSNEVGYCYVMQAMRVNLDRAQSEAQTLREDNAAKDKKIAQLEKTVMQQAAALPPAVKSIKQKD